MSILARAALQNKWAWVGERIDSSEGEQSTACGRVICSDAQANNKGFRSYKQRRTTRSVLVSMPWQAVGHSVIVATHCTRTSSMCWTTKWLERVRIRFDRSREASGQQRSNRSNDMNGIMYAGVDCVCYCYFWNPSLLLLLLSVWPMYLSCLLMSCHCHCNISPSCCFVTFCGAGGGRVTSKIAAIANLTNALTRQRVARTLRRVHSVIPRIFTVCSHIWPDPTGRTIKGLFIEQQ